MARCATHGRRAARRRARCSTGSFRRALLVGGACAARRRSATAPHSVSSAAVQLAKKIFGSLAGTTRDGARRRRDGRARARVAARTRACARRSSRTAPSSARRSSRARYGATARALRRVLGRARRRRRAALLDRGAAPVVSARARAAGGSARRGDRPLCILDIAVPRDVDPAVGEHRQRLPLRPRRPARRGAREASSGGVDELPAAEEVIAERGRAVLAVGGGTRRRAGADAVPRGDGSRARARARHGAAAARSISRPSRRAAVEQLVAVADEQVPPRADGAAARRRRERSRARASSTRPAISSRSTGAQAEPQRDERSTITTRLRRRTSADVHWSPAGAGFIGSHVAERVSRARVDGARHRQLLVTGKRENVDPASATFTSSTFASPKRRGSSTRDAVRRHRRISPRRSTCGRASPIPCIDASDQHRRLAQSARGGAPERPRPADARSSSPPPAARSTATSSTPPNVENYPKDPESPYAIAKLSVEYYLAYYARVHGLDTVALRFAQRVRPAAGPARRGGRRRDLLRADSRGPAADGLRRRRSRRATTSSSATSRDATWSRGDALGAAPPGGSTRGRSTSARASETSVDRARASCCVERAQRTCRSSMRRSARASSSDSVRRASRKAGSLLGWRPRVTRSRKGSRARFDWFAARHTPNRERAAAGSAGSDDRRCSPCRLRGAVPTTPMELITRRDAR